MKTVLRTGDGARIKQEPQRPVPLDDLLIGFRAVASIDFRILDIERFLLTNRPPQDSPAFWRRWTTATMRLLKLIQVNPQLEQHHDQIHDYLLRAYRGAA